MSALHKMEVELKLIFFSKKEGKKPCLIKSNKFQNLTELFDTFIFKMFPNRIFPMKNNFDWKVNINSSTSDSKRNITQYKKSTFALAQ